MPKGVYPRPYVDPLDLIHYEPMSGCWLWGGTYGYFGYGVFKYSGQKSRPAHRVVYEILRGEIQPGLHLDHLCRNHACVNPDHLEPVTSRVNTLRGVGPSAVNAKKTHCKNGHEFTPENTMFVDGGRARACRKCNRKHALAHYYGAYRETRMARYKNAHS